MARLQQQNRTAANKPPEWHLCRADPAYFIHNYVLLFNATDERWRPFHLWPAQRTVLEQMSEHRQLVVLKARQLGLTWLCLAYALHHMVFGTGTVGIFSRREEDAQELMDARLKGMYRALPDWLRPYTVMEDNKTSWRLSNGSTARAFATNGGRQYTFSLVLVDEADFQPDLPGLLTAVQPTIDAGGRMWLISSANKDLPMSRFKAIYRNAKRGGERWQPVFLPWTARPSRTPEWYEAQRQECLETTGATDDLLQEYPATDTEAISPRTLDKRIPAPWLEDCFTELQPLPFHAGPALPNLEIYRPPLPERMYVIGVDPAEGNPTSDDSALTVMDVLTGEEMAVLSGKFEPAVMAGYADALGVYYNKAGLMVERNNHGHAVLLWLEEHSALRRLSGHDSLPGKDERPGWLSSKLGKTLLYNGMAEAFRPPNPDTLLHSFATYLQLASIEGSTLLAPQGQKDDRADSYALAHAGRAAMVVAPAAMRQAPIRGQRHDPDIRQAVRRIAR